VAAVVAPVEMCELADEELARLVIDLPEFNRVLGGGIVPGSLILVGGDPGIGKSTLMLQAAVLAAATDRRRVLYISGEESAQQLKMRARRLGTAGEGIFLLSETNLDGALQQAEALQPSLMVVDSIQTVYTAAAPSPPGSIGQLRECTMRLMQWAKRSAVPTCIVGHVTKEGDIAGPRLLEHIVDVVLYLEGERFSSYRLLRGVKNRFGSTNEVGVFEMTGEGLIGVEDPSEVFLAERGEEAVGSVVVSTLEGSRPLLVEVQALTSPTMLASPRRTANGLDFNRLVLICAVLTKRAGLALGRQDIIANVVGGLRVHEPAADLGLALAVASSYRDTALPRDLVAIGEVGLSGELRSVSQMERRLAEAERLGFARCLLPQAALRRGAPASGMQLIPAASLREAIRLVFA
jgi:DNA repair protein RadA/Sms